MANNHKIMKVAIVGGTHGNELTGVYLVKKWLKNGASIIGESFKTTLLIANETAIENCTRYVDKDLNRCFTHKDLNGSECSDIEQARAREINTILGPKGSAESQDLIFDLHNTTANMGVTLIYSQVDELAKKILSKLNQNPLVNLYYMPENLLDSPYLPSIGKRDICVEVGPQAHGTIRADLFFSTESVIIEAIKTVDQINTDGEFEERNNIVYTHFKNFDYPRNSDGSISAMIHPNLQGRDYQVIHKGDPLFITFDAEVVYYTEDEDIYPVFINEHAYYEKNIAFSATKKSIERF